MVWRITTINCICCFSWKLVIEKIHILIRGGLWVCPIEISQVSRYSQEELLGIWAGQVIRSNLCKPLVLFLFPLSHLLYFLFVVFPSISSFRRLFTYLVYKCFQPLIFQMILFSINVFQTSTIHTLLYMKLHVQHDKYCFTSGTSREREGLNTILELEEIYIKRLFSKHPQLRPVGGKVSARAKPPFVLLAYNGLRTSKEFWSFIFDEDYTYFSNISQEAC